MRGKSGKLRTRETAFLLEEDGRAPSPGRIEEKGGLKAFITEHGMMTIRHSKKKNQGEKPRFNSVGGAAKRGKGFEPKMEFNP